MNCIVVHYSEIGLKGKNRDFFERKLISNLRLALPKKAYEKVSRLHGRIVIELAGKSVNEKMLERLRKIPGISHFSLAVSSERDIGSIKKSLVKIAGKQLIKTFAVNSTRSDKSYKHTSRQLNEALGDFLRKKYKWGVDLSKPDLTFFVEVTEKKAFAYTEKIRGLGGLPVTTGGKLVSLISGGIDSPVAASEMFKRGCSVVFVHFHNWTKDKDIVRDKVERIVKLLSEYQPVTKLYLVPFGELQKEIIMLVPAKYRMIVYRRVMFWIANRIAGMEHALGFVTGDSIGQVASQTLENLNVIYGKAELPVFSPLVGMNKQEIIDMANRIGTYEMSILPHSDCCSFLVAEHPETRAKLDVIEKTESGLKLDKLVDSALKKSKVKKF
jgi:thiamine biosynthesis protein ThiI